MDAMDRMATDQRLVTGDGKGADAERMVPVPESLLEQLLQTEAAYVASSQVRAVSMHEILDTMQAHRVAKFIHMELPKRIAVRMSMIESLVGWQMVPELVQSHENLSCWYRDLRLVRRSREVGLKEFIAVMKKIKRQGDGMVGLGVLGMHKWYSSSHTDHTDEFVNKWLDDYFMIRIGSNMLVDQCIALASVEDGGLGHPTGIVDTNCDIVRICERAAQYAKALCEVQLGRSPVYSIETSAWDSPAPHDFSYIPRYLRYIMVELIKNSFKATVERSTDDANLRARPVRILVSSDSMHCGIRVSDQAGGIPFDVGKRIWSYLYGAAGAAGSVKLARGGENNSDGVPIATPLAGWGVGLPISRLHARYLGGTLILCSYPGMGTDVSLFLPTISRNQVEVLKK